jgi:hypothetical protein
MIIFFYNKLLIIVCIFLIKLRVDGLFESEIDIIVWVLVMSVESGCRLNPMMFIGNCFLSKYLLEEFLILNLIVDGIKMVLLKM